MNEKDALHEITVEENEQKMKLLKDEVESTRSCLREARECVEQAEKVLKQAKNFLKISEENWDNVLKKNVQDVELPGFQTLIPFHEFQMIPLINPYRQFDPSSGFKCMIDPMWTQVGYALEKIEVGESVYLSDGGFVKHCV